MCHSAKSTRRTPIHRTAIHMSRIRCSGPHKGKHEFPRTQFGGRRSGRGVSRWSLGLGPHPDRPATGSILEYAAGRGGGGFHTRTVLSENCGQSTSPEASAFFTPPCRSRKSIFLLPPCREDSDRRKTSPSGTMGPWFSQSRPRNQAHANPGRPVHHDPHRGIGAQPGQVASEPRCRRVEPRVLKRRGRGVRIDLDPLLHTGWTSA